MRHFITGTLLTFCLSNTIATAQPPETAIRDAVALCQNWIDTGAAIDADEGWVFIGHEDHLSFHANTDFQILIATQQIDTVIVSPPPEKIVSKLICDVRRVSDLTAFPYASTFVPRGGFDRFKVYDLGTDWANAEAIADEIAVTSTLQTLGSYTNSPHYYELWVSSDYYIPIEGVNMSETVSLGRCTKKDFEQIFFEWGPSQDSSVSNINIVIEKRTGKDEPHEYPLECLVG